MAGPFHFKLSDVAVPKEPEAEIPTNSDQAYALLKAASVAWQAASAKRRQAQAEYEAATKQISEAAAEAQAAEAGARNLYKLREQQLRHTLAIENGAIKENDTPDDVPEGSITISAPFQTHYCKTCGYEGKQSVSCENCGMLL